MTIRCVRRGEHAGEVVREVEARAEQPLDLAAEHVEREHVEEDVRDAAVQEAVADELPGLEAGAGLQAGARRPKGEPLDERQVGRRLQQEDGDVGYDQRLGDRGHGQERDSTAAMTFKRRPAPGSGGRSPAG